MIIVLCLAAFLGSCFLTYLIRRYALAKSVIDVPNARSSHSVPTPRGGGLAVVIVFLGIAFGWGFIPYETIAASVLVAGIGFWDDHRHIPARWRLLVHFCATTLAVTSLYSVPDIPFFDPPEPCCFHCFTPKPNPHWLIYGFYIVALVWLLNLYNFMDGIDGIASVEAITVALSVALFCARIYVDNDYVLSLLLLSASLAGFLVWNWPHAKIFMGDACSGFLGFILGVLALMTSATDLINIWSWLILLGVFITDATFTLIKRILKGEVWYEAHSSHAYQHYARQLIHKFQQQGYEHQDARTKSHRHINLQLILINFCWLFPLAVAATSYPFWSALIAAIAYLPLIFIAQRLKAGSSQ